MLYICVLVRKTTRSSGVWVDLVRLSYDVALENLHQILEEVDVNEMRIFGYTPQGRWQKRCRMRVLEYSKV